ncbi:MAG TPA: DUF6452 family protein [Cyclobacteriaceae bacterium]|nr:DUF6452 family protein [Cyclobacteriaceae bacterium]
MIKKVAWFSFFALLAMSCLDDPDCYNLSLNVIGISFKKIADGKADTVALIGVSMEGTDSIFYPSTLATGVFLPLNYLQNQSTIVFGRPGIPVPYTNTLNLGYEAKAQFVSEDCGERFVLSKLNILSSDFDSTRLVSSSPTKNPSTNIIIYRCPISDFVRFSFRQWYTDEEEGSDLEVVLNGATDDFTNYPPYYQGQEASTFRLPINAASTATTFDIDFKDFGITTITLGYKSVSDVLYIPCGEQAFFSDISIEDYSSEFNKVTIIHDSIQDPPVTNVAFYRCPVTNWVKIVFRESATSSATSPVNIVKITADYTSEEFYVGANEISTIELPLNEQADVTNFTFTLDTGVKTLQLHYGRTTNLYHEICNQTEMASLEVTASDFTTQVLDATVQFPTTNNIAIINN